MNLTGRHPRAHSVTAKDVAQRLGVAVSTVGRALANDSRISEETKQRVRVAAAKAGYVASTPARVMRGGSSKLIGLIVPNVLNDFYATIAQELSTCCEAAGYQLALSIANDDRDSEFRHVQKFAAARAAGIVIVPCAQPRPQTVALLATTPHVQLLRRSPALRAEWFGIDDERALFEAARFLVTSGHRRIGYVGGFEALPTGKQRLAGFRRALGAHATRNMSTLIKLGPPTAEFGLSATMALLKRTHPPTAIAFGSVSATLGAIEAIERSRLRVPADVSIVGFGDPPWFAWLGTGLTTVQLPIRDLARACGADFLHRLETRTKAPLATAELEHVERSATLVVRGSVRIIS